MMDEVMRDNRRRPKVEKIVRQAYTNEKETAKHTEKMMNLAPILFDITVEEQPEKSVPPSPKR